MNKNSDTNRVESEPNENNSIVLEIPQKEFEELQNGTKKFIDITIDQHSYPFILENIDGNLILQCDEMPNEFYACYFWNNGLFPYLVKRNLKYIILLNRKRVQKMVITGYTSTVMARYDFCNDNSLKANPDGKACVWLIRFKVCSLI